MRGMRMAEQLFFKVNAGIKNIVGKELIHSDNVAIIELVKNSKDADASFCKIFFNKEIKHEGVILILDDGCGMTKDDIVNKWLNVAYSAKKNLKKKNGYFAGNKGVGRFSCDRLGKKLTLYTKSAIGSCCRLSIDWGDFENRDIQSTMSSIPILFDELSMEEFQKEIDQYVKIQNFSKGTLLIITELRSEWTDIFYFLKKMYA